jgi:cysteinyl-tRNA synthetase
MILRNSLSKKHEIIEPIHEGSISIYSCGPTVYNDLHIGNLSAFIYADILRRALATEGYTIKHVMNITDVDDKTIRDSAEKYPKKEPQAALKTLTNKYTKVFMADLKATGNDVDAMTFISAVATIPEMIVLTQELLNKGIAYIADDGVYFSITKYYQSGHTYGVLQKIATQQSQARISNDEYDKDSASDFALWKRAVPGEPFWDAIFSEDLMETIMPGRPGWHIECSAMSEKALGLPFDIHTGGIDLKFPHHENEIAQSIGAGAEDYAHYFMHNNHILVDGKKMSKSLGNFYTLRDIEKKGFSPQDFRLMVLESHYHSEANFSWEILQAAKNRLRNWQAAADRRFQLPQDTHNVSSAIARELQANLSTPQALQAIDLHFDSAAQKGMAPNSDVLTSVQYMIGIDLLATSDISDDAKLLIKARQASRNKKDWAASDKIREDLRKKFGLQIKDVQNGQIWSRY